MTESVPEAMLDYAFVRKHEDERPLTILVTKDRDSRVTMANVVLRKGRGLDDTVEQATKNVLVASRNSVRNVQ